MTTLEPEAPERELVRYEMHGHTAVITMNRPERLNALSVALMAELDRCFRRFIDDDDAWVAVLTNEGRAFSTGMDIKERLADGPPQHSDIPYWDYNLFWEERIEKPTIAAVGGYAYGGGFFFTTRCDLRIASESAQFQVTEPIRGGIAGYELQLHENLPYAVAAELSAGITYSAARAYEVGLVNAVVPDAELRDAALAMADALCAVPPLALHHNLRLLRDIRREGRRLSHATITDVRRVWDELNDSEDTKEAFLSFVEKRPPVYRRR